MIAANTQHLERPQLVVPIRDGRLALSTWQNLFLCDFDGPRERRVIMVTIVGHSSG